MHMASFGNLNITQENRFPQNFSSISACDTFYESACHVGKRANNIIVKYNFFHDTISQYSDACDAIVYRANLVESFKLLLHLASG